MDACLFALQFTCQISTQLFRLLTMAAQRFGWGLKTGDG